MCKTWCVFSILLHKLIKTHHVLHFFFKKWSKNGPKTAPRRLQDGPRIRTRFWTNFWSHLGTILGPFFGHFGVDFWIIFESYILRANEDILDNFTALRCLLDASWDRSWGLLGGLRGARTLKIFEQIEDPPFLSANRSWDHFGTIWAPSWALSRSPTNCLEGSKSTKIGPRGTFSAPKKGHL